MSGSRVSSTAMPNRHSMANPVYLVDNSRPAAAAAAQPTAAAALAQQRTCVDLLKYYTKVDAGIQLNNLTQEVNMPLLRLVHQLYSIIVDAIENDKEQHEQQKLPPPLPLPLGSGNGDTGPPPPPLSDTPSQSEAARRDCWRFMNQILELREFVPEPKYLEKNETQTTTTTATTTATAPTTANNPVGGKGGVHKRYTHTTHVPLAAAGAKEKSFISFYGWVFVKRVQSKAGIGILSFGGEMNNIQASVLLDHKMLSPYTGTATSSGGNYVGSVNLSIESTLGKLKENESRQNVVQMRVGKSHVFGSFRSSQATTLTTSGVILLASFVHVGQINIDVPLRPMIIHGVVYRESKVIEHNILPEIKNFAIFENQDLAGAAASTAAGATTEQSSSTASAAGLAADVNNAK